VQMRKAAAPRRSGGAVVPGRKRDDNAWTEEQRWPWSIRSRRRSRKPLPDPRGGEELPRGNRRGRDMLPRRMSSQTAVKLDPGEVSTRVAYPGKTPGSRRGIELPN